MSIWIRILTLLLPLGIIVGSVTGFVILSRQPERFPLRAIEIHDELKHISREEISDAVSKHMSKGFFWLDVGAVQESLKNIPWVALASVKRVWPDKIVISIKEKNSQARWGDEGILSTEGVVFYPDVSLVKEKLPLFQGPKERSREMIQNYLSFLEALSPLALGIQGLEVSETGTWKIMLDNEIDIILGKNNLTERLTRFILVYKGSLQAQAQRVAYVDLRYTNGMAIGWKGGLQ